jgi:2-oxoglutarate ferredoxin oxidoreductase subunit beta
VREHNEAVSRIDFISPASEITAQRARRGGRREQHDGTLLRLRKLHEATTPPTAMPRMNYMQQHQARGEVVTGLLYVDPLATDLHTALNTSAAPLNSLDADRCAPARQRWRGSMRPCASAARRLESTQRSPSWQNARFSSHSRKSA